MDEAHSPDVVAVIGGGPAGLAVAATLVPLGFRVRVLEKADAIGARWRGHYDRLHLHTTRTLSSLPGLAIPRECGRWVSRDDFVRYLDRYVEHHALAPELGTTVERLDRAGDGWKLLTSRGDVEAKFVVVGGGYNNVPSVPAWPGRDRFTGELIHSHRYRNGARYQGKRVLVAGTGNSGAEIATDLADHGAEVWWSFRTPPNILPRAALGVATQGLGILLRPLPPRIVDAIAAGFAWVTVGNLAKFGLPRPSGGLYTRARRDRVLPILDVGLVTAIKSGQVRPVPAIESFDASSVVLGDQQRLAPDAVIACTGFRPALEPILGHLGVLDRDGVPLVHGSERHAHAPGVFFVGYNNPISGNLREIARHARQIAGVLRGTFGR
jgi:putative flavoprotein involved in K+ transport